MPFQKGFKEHVIQGRLLDIGHAPSWYVIPADSGFASDDEHDDDDDHKNDEDDEEEVNENDVQGNEGIDVGGSGMVDTTSDDEENYYCGNDGYSSSSSDDEPVEKKKKRVVKIYMITINLLQ